MEYAKMNIAELSALLRNREVSAKELAADALQAIAETDGNIGAYLTVAEEEAYRQAAAADEMLANGTAGALTGIPFAMKDNICTKGVRTTCASKMLENWYPVYDACVTERLKAAGAVMLGKTNMDEFAMGSSTENSALQITHNPASAAHVPGGSSGGSAAAVAADECAFAIGSDTGGSIRQPASFCGVVGMKPTYGTVSRYGLVAYASSFDQIGPLTKNVADNAAVLEAISCHDRRDSTSLPQFDTAYSSLIGKDLNGMRIGLPKEYFGEGIHPTVAKLVRDAAQQLEKAGAVLEECTLPAVSYALPAYYVLCCAEASSNLARFDGIRYGYRAQGVEDLDQLYRKTRTEGFGREVRRRILLGNYVLSAGYYDAYYKKAQQARTLLIRAFADLFGKYDMLLTPVAPTPAYKIGEKSSDPMQMALGDICTVPVNLGGLPAISVPCGTAEEDGANLPVGFQLIGPAFSEAKLYQAAYAYESANK
ncbi:MAG: Asp-tRNA(Asn)/Glu-tRNA(Gln) amidotransferase subunit GatA [Oscillospiraceae bacterium]|nr:Asp-tRNA(Asn)/Glu-tRNA(Gln) amidotransferase subunit GatA [Oscillospiraceae bacterium]